jgi:hypothetical protein
VGLVVGNSSCLAWVVMESLTCRVGGLLAYSSMSEVDGSSAIRRYASWDETSTDRGLVWDWSFAIHRRVEMRSST